MFLSMVKNRPVFLIRSNTFEHVRLIVDIFSTIQLNIYVVKILSYILVFVALLFIGMIVYIHKCRHCDLDTELTRNAQRNRLLCTYF